VTVDQATCQHITPWNTPTPCDSARDFLTKAGVSFATAATKRFRTVMAGPALARP
jgi:hypothetical protein